MENNWKADQTIYMNAPEKLHPTARQEQSSEMENTWKADQTIYTNAQDNSHHFTGMDQLKDVVCKLLEDRTTLRSEFEVITYTLL